MIWGSLIIDIGVAAVGVIAAQIAIPSRGIKYLKWQALVALFNYLANELMYYFFLEREAGDTWLFIVSSIFEVSMAYILVWIGLKGNYWRNFIVLTLSIMATNMIVSVIASESKLLAEAYYKYCDYELDIDIKSALIICLLSIIVSFAVAFILRKIFTFNYKKNGNIYRIFAILYNIFVIVVGVSRKIIEANGHIANNKAIFISSVISLLFASIVPFNILGVIYNRLENKRVLEERNTLKSMIKNSTLQYIKVTASNEKLKEINERTGLELSKEIQDTDSNRGKYIEELTENIKLAGLMVCDSVTGDLYVDIVLSEHENILKEENIAFETTVDSSVYEYFQGMEISTFVDCGLLIAEAYAKKSAEDKMIILSVRRAINAIVMKVEFSKDSNEKLNKRIVERMIRKLKSNALNKTMEIYYPKLMVTDSKDRGKVSFIIEIGD